MANAAERITDVLSLIAARPNGLSAAEVGEALCLSRTAASRLLSLMAEAALVERDASTQRYVLALDLWVTGAAALQRLQVIEVSQLPMAEAVSAIGNPLFIGVNRGTQTYVLRAVDCVRGFPIVHPIALKRPIPELATGKAILAFDAPERVAVAIDGLFESGDDGACRREQFVQELERSHERGYALKYCEGESAVNGIAVAVIDRTGFAAAGLSVSLQPVRLDDFSPEPILSAIRGAADAISRYLGFTRFTAAVVP